MKVLGIVPARAGSKRLPRKNVLPLGDKPLVAWVIEAGLRARSLSRLVVSSDDDEVLRIAEGYGHSLPLRRPPELATDISPAIDYVRHALQTLEGSGEGPFDAVAILQPSSPLTQSDDIDATVALLAASGAPSAVSVMKLDHAIHPYKLKVLQGDRLLPFIEEEDGRMAAHELPELYVRNCAVYAARRETIERGTIVAEDCRAHVMPRERSIDINDRLDYELAKLLLGHGPSD